MSLRKLKPTSPGRRGMVTMNYEDVTTDTPHKPLLKKMKNAAGRNNYGRITCRHRGGRQARAYRVVDFKRNNWGIEGRVMTIEYDPNRNVRISLIHFMNGDKRYILHPEGLKIGDTVVSGPQADIKTGNAMPLKNVPLGTYVHNIELRPGHGGKMVRSAGVGAQLVARENGKATLKLPSGEMRMVFEQCMATLGTLGNADFKNLKFGKAGRTRHKGFRPTVRGSVMNPVDHPHGGGEGRAPIGRSGPVTPWGKPALGRKTRNRKKPMTMIVRRRKA